MGQPHSDPIFTESSYYMQLENTCGVNSGRSAACSRCRSDHLKSGLLVSIVCALALTYVMGQRFLETSKIMPAGVVAGLSALMSAFYLFKVATGGNHIPPKKE